jgi:hypothetical protein
MEMLLALSALAGFYFFYRTIVLSKKVELLSKKLIVSRYSLPEEKQIAEDSFFKFISDSRDWAFEYIEEVQGALLAFQKEVGPLISYFDTYGDVLSNERPDYKAMKTISDEYKKLVSILPEEQKND